MRKRVLSFLLAASAAFCFICSSAPKAQAIIPIGLVQSALASYVTSAGYKMWSDNGGGELMVEALSTLYQSWLDSTDPVGALTLGQMSENDYIYLDSSGQIVIRKAAADIFQDFADWIQTEYSVPVGSDTPTAVLQSSGGVLSNSDGTIVARSFICNNPYTPSNGSTSGYYSSDAGTVTDSGSTYSCYIATSIPCTIYCTSFNNSYWYAVDIPSVANSVSYYFVSDRNGSGTFFIEGSGSLWNNNFSQSAQLTKYFFPDVPASSVRPGSFTDLTESSGGTVGLAVTLAQAVADVVGQAKEDDAVVIGVGASAGTTAQDIADMVAQGIKAQTLEPSVSITAEDVIDTPVQPYPDIDGLGLPTLGAALVDRFPFCIPWDFVDTVKLLSAEPQPINIKIDLIPQRIKTSVGITSDTSFDIDLSGEQYSKIGVFCRWGSLITFCFGLFLLTKRLVWTA